MATDKAGAVHWARMRTAEGQVLTGVIAGDLLHPRVSLGAQDSAGEAVALQGATLLPPCVPGKFIGLWNNFHAAATRNALSIPEHPLWFLKPASALSGHGAEVAMPADAGRIVFEGELGIVIGQTCRNATLAEAEAAILGYTCVNDFTALEILFSDPSFPQWTRAKGFDGFGAVGPVIATGLDWAALSIKVLVNGRERQSYLASDMILPPAEIVAKLSRDVTLAPGDVIACGTSLGARPVKAGNVVEVVIEGIGTLATRMVADGAAG